MIRLSRSATAAAAAVLLPIVSLAAQGRTVPVNVSSVVGADNVKAFIGSRMAKGFVPPRTAWGDPNISGVFTTKDEANTPFERPDEWAGRRMDDITPKEFAEAVARRQERATEAAPFAGGGEPEQGVAIAVPIHWFDNLAARNSRPWFVVEWTVTLDDPTTWERPWTYSMPMTEDNTQLIFEYACHEGNYGMANLLSAGRAAENRK